MNKLAITDIITVMDEKKEKRREYMREYMRSYNRNPEYMAYRRGWMKKWHKENHAEIYKRRRARPYEKLAASVRTRMRECIKYGYKSEKTEALLGIPVKELKVYLERMFVDGMNWENYGKWHIDHIIPLSSFDLSQGVEQKKAFHYTNLQPLWAKDNLQKHAKRV